MLALVLAAMTVSPSPSPTPLLKTIVTVKSSPLCGEFAAHANAAIGSAVLNDASLGSTILALRSNDLAAGTIDRTAELHRLSDLADSIYRQYRAGEREVGILRDLASKTTDPQEKAALKDSADALGGTLYRQHLMQRDLDGFVSYLETADMRGGWDEAESNAARSLGGSDIENGAVENDGPAAYWLPPGYDRYLLPAPLMVGHESVDDDVRMAASASSDFQDRMLAVERDEMTAGGRIEQAADNC
ncbi:MAG TPA: hypothetical protein VMF11_03655 [Candidatus Baltobacteraceae bacterium]|nr:hypothetical protein [Candidatus Baltobacteraceae bacterium]